MTSAAELCVFAGVLAVLFGSRTSTKAIGAAMALVGLAALAWSGA